MRTFTKLREALIDNKDLRKELEGFKRVTEERFGIVFQTLDKLLQIEDKPKKKIGHTVKEKGVKELIYHVAMTFLAALRLCVKPKKGAHHDLDSKSV